MDTYRTSRCKYNGMWKIERGVGTLSIEEMKNVDVRVVKREELADIREVEVNKRKSQEGQIRDYLEQIKNPYCYRYGEYIVKIGFEDTTVTLTDRLQELILKTLFMIRRNQRNLRIIPGIPLV